MAEDDLLGLHAVICQKLCLLRSHLSQLAVRSDGTADLRRYMSRSLHDLLLAWSDLRLFSSNLADNAWLDSGIADAIFELVGKDLLDLLYGSILEPCRVEHFKIETCRADNIDAKLFRIALEIENISAHIVAADFDDALRASIAKPSELFQYKRRVAENRILVVSYTSKIH